ncbi:MAG: TetR-like C-terminal domain-containing protein [Atopobium sp.]|uniref:TetR/AcrR family transcriptional regulator n=1 Tax=Atopobium sp. TaxID=1872650 RepID=UPI002A81A8C8|nr:TetR-like C-terminal domain-containing protein [Atopobium sp.]MDY4522210.1 TetR-like C-terminal domain-containing protein [Atopobium sp.]
MRVRIACEDTPPASHSVVTASTDKRIVRTRRALRDALATEIEKTGDLSQVTVTAVCDSAQITRRTFYLHFKDIPDLVRATEDETLKSLRPYIARIAATNLDGLQDAISQLQPCPGVIEALEFLKERGSYMSALLGDGGDPGFTHRIELLVRDVVHKRAAEGINEYVGEALLDYYLTYTIAAEVGVLVRWLTRGMQEDVSIISRVMTALMFVRPGDLYNRRMNFNVGALGAALAFYEGEQL